jgi:hypothetical protein
MEVFKMIYSQIDDTHGKVTYSLHWVYAHGELENFLGYNNIDTDSLDLANKHRFISEGNHATYVIDEFAQNELGEIRKIKIYLWQGGKIPRGMAVWVHDKEGIADALDKFERLSEML